ncbi:MAG: YebC/PmpR family DNA-binding transcriptional regulator [Nitrospinota bacterium]
MAGHSKWAGIKHKKAIIDAKRGKLFTKLAKEISVASKIGGPDPDANARLRTAISKAKGYSLPAANIDRAVKKGAGGLEGLTYEEIVYEGYAPAGIAILVETLTDNKNRTVAQIRSLLTKAGGQIGQPGSVIWMFQRRGLIIVESDGIDDLDRLMEIALNANAIDFTAYKEFIEIETEPDELDSIRTVLLDAQISIKSSEIFMSPKNPVKIDDEATGKKVSNLIDSLEDLDDVQNVYTTLEPSTDLLLE